ncbi:MAG: hypothetical protein UR86_C0019G0010, partial [Parcubacteria group bacterium GW2011_GWD2_35_7]
VKESEQIISDRINLWILFHRILTINMGTTK